MLSKVISGGQTGVDCAALRAAAACGVERGGWCPVSNFARAVTYVRHRCMTSLDIP